LQFNAVGMDFNNELDSPLQIRVSFHKLIARYERLQHSENVFIANTARTILDHVDKYPKLKGIFSSFDEIYKYDKEIEFLLQDLFHPALTENEIKAVSVPFHDHVFMKSQRFQDILNVYGKDTMPEVKNMNSEYWYIIASSIILKACYGYELNFKRPFFYEIPDANGVMRYYKILYNADFIDVIPKPNAPEITSKDYDDLLDNFENIALWKEKFPPHSYVFKGFIISNIFDVTDDQSISNIKTALIGLDKRHDDTFMDNFQEVFRSLLGLEKLKIGFSKYNQNEDSFEKVYGYAYGVNSYLIKNKDLSRAKESLCDWSYNRLLNEKKIVSFSDVEAMYANPTNPKPQLKALHDQGFKSAIFAPIANDEELLGILEIVSEEPKVLNSINAQKLVDVMPYIISALEQSKSEEANRIEAIIQKECTSIHPSVHWRFEEEARKYINDEFHGKEPVFNSIGFDNIYPLFGQMDVKNSSQARNNATINDLNFQLQQLKHIFKGALKAFKLPIYEKFLYQINDYIASLNEFFQVDSEQQITAFIKSDLHPVLEHLSNDRVLKKDINTYFDGLEPQTRSFYRYRKNYDEAIAMINKHMSALLDEKQIEAQAMYPHYYERFKTDGVEHNMYIGNSLTKLDDFNPVYLYNLRLWQLQVMCEMENAYYQKQSEFKIKLDVASMILVFNQPLSISYRMDEKQFDVDGTYNARYEIVKKRVDKAYIKGTTERITQKGKLSIIYSQKESEEEYLNYIKFLQTKNYLNDDIEILELEDLDAVSGLKAIRVGIMYHKSKEDKAFYSYEDLMNEITN